MAHAMKHTKAAAGHMCSHYDRSANNISNKSIDLERTKDNYNLGPERNMSQMDFINQRCGEVKCLNRKDVNVMCSWVVTAPNDLPQEDMKKFFEASYDFLKNRYGEKNVVSAHVHMDEGQPHLHYAFVPVVTDQRKGTEKVSAKECIDKKDLQTFHKDLDNRMTEVFGRNIGILNEATKEGNKSIEELKRKSATERLQDANHEAQEHLKEVEKECSTMLSNAHKEVEAIKDSLAPLKTEYESRKAFIDQSVKDSDPSKMYPDYAKVNKSLLGKETVTVPKDKWEARHISANQISALEKEREGLEQGIEKIRKSAPGQKIKSLEDELHQLRTENKKINLKLDEALKDIDRVNRVFEKQPEIQKIFFEAEKALTRNSRGFQMER